MAPIGWRSTPSSQMVEPAPVLRPPRRDRLRDVVLGALRAHAARPWELVDAVTDVVVEFIATERRPVFRWPPVLETDCEVLRQDGQWEHVARRRDGQWERYDTSGAPWGGGNWWESTDWPWVWRHSIEPADGGFGARHQGRPGQTVADADEMREAYKAALNSDARRAASEIEPLGVLLDLLRQEREDKP